MNQSSVERGRLALKTFHNFSVSNFSSSYGFASLDDLIAAIKKQKGALFVEEYIGDLATLLEMSESDVDDAMIDLAKKAHGRVPENWMTWGAALQDKVENYSFVDALKYTVVESSKDVAGGLAEAGDAAIFTLKVMKFLIPALIIGGIGWIGFSRIKQVAGK